MYILIVEDEKKIVDSLKLGLTEAGISADFAFTGLEGYNLAISTDYDVIVTDIVLPEINGIELVYKLRSAGIISPIMLLTALGGLEDKVLGLESGADDYLVKPFEFKELLARIRALSRRSPKNAKNQTTIKFQDLKMNLDRLEVTRNDVLINLTSKEFQLLEYLIKNEGRVISKAELTEKVWGLDFETNTNVVEVYINYLRNKIDKPFETKTIHTIFGSGYILKDV